MTADELLAIADAYRRLPDARRRKRIREDAGASQRALAEAAGVVPLTVHRWERGARPRPYVVERYVALLEQLETASAK